MNIENTGRFCITCMTAAIRWVWTVNQDNNMRVKWITSFLLQKAQKTFSERTTNPNPNRRTPSDQGHITAGLSDSGGSISVAALVREHVGWGYFIYVWCVLFIGLYQCSLTVNNTGCVAVDGVFCFTFQTIWSIIWEEGLFITSMSQYVQFI